MTSFRMKVLLFAIAILLGGTFLIVKGKWPLDKIGEIYSGINIANEQSAPFKTDSAEPESLRFATYETPRPVPDISFYNAEGGVFSLKDWQGQKLIVNLWATWCAPCVQELPRLDNLKTILEKKNAGIEVIAISIDSQKNFDDIRNFFKNHGVTALTPFLDLDRTVMARMQISGFPITYILNEDGLEITRYEGVLEWDNPKVVDALLKL